MSAPSVISRMRRSGCEAATVEQRLDPVGEPGVEQLAGRDVDADRGRAALPISELQRRASSHAATSTCWPISSMSPVSSANGMNASGAERAAFGMVPADERFERGDAARCAARRSAGSARRARRVRPRRGGALRSRAARPRRGASRARTRARSSCRPPWRCTSRGRRCGASRRSRRPTSRTRCRRSRSREICNASSTTGSCSAARMRSATSVASFGSSSSSMSTANSSPPSRAAVSPARRQLVSRSLTITSSSSPAEWPRLSLTVLKSSRSMNSTASWPPWRCSRVAAWSTRSRNSAWFASPVSGSWNAWWVSSFWSRRCSVTSRKLHTRPTTSPSMRCGSESRSNTRPSLNSSMSWLSASGSS